MTKVKIVSTGSYLPPKIVTDDVFDERFNLEKGTTLRKSGVKNRHYVENESQVDMAVKAINEALKNTDNKNIDCIVFAGGVPQQLIPCTASLIQQALGRTFDSIPCFDINSTCLSFVTAFNVISYLIDNGVYNRVLLVSSDIASVGINYEDYSSSILFGDGAAAAVIEKTPDKETSEILTYNFKTYAEGADHARIRGGSGYLPAWKYTEENKEEYKFHMNGLKLYEIASKKLVKIFNDALAAHNLTIDDIKLVIPHQASLMAMKLIQRKLKIPTEKYLYNIENQGNTIASSIPLCLDYSIKNKLIQRGDKVVLLGTSAGLSIGVMVFEY